MRDPNRLDAFYDSLRTIHQELFPDLRFGQLIMVFENWHQAKYHTDCFYLEEGELLAKFKEFAGVMPRKA